MSNKAVTLLSRVLYIGVLSFAVALPVQAEWGFSVFTAEDMRPAGKDRAFEYEVMRLMDEHAAQLEGVDAVVTRFGNTIVITGQARDAGDRARIDQLVLGVAGITRKVQGEPTVVPASTLACDGKSMPANTKRRQTVKPNRDCSSLRAESGLHDEATGRVFNHVAVGSTDPVKQLAHAELLAAQARMALLDAGVVDSIDRNTIRLVAQQGVLYVLGGLDAVQQSAIRALLDKLPGVNAVQFYVE